MRIIKQDLRQIVIDDKEYPVDIIYKTGKKNITFRYKNGRFVVTSPLIVRQQTIKDGLIKFAPRLLKTNTKNRLFTDDYIFILGNKYLIKDNKIWINDKQFYSFKSKETLIKELKIWFLDVISNLVHTYQEKMGIKQEFTIHIKQMKSRYGSYSRKTQSLSFGFELIHYDIEIAKSVVVHELSHYYVFNHSSKFYEMVLKYYPNYYQIHNKLRKGIVK